MGPWTHHPRSSTVGRMQRKISDAQIAAALETLESGGHRVTWRRLRLHLLSTLGVAGRTDRLRRACRALGKAQRPTQADLTPDTAALSTAQEQLVLALEQRDRALERAARAEERETRHQDRWAEQIYALRQELDSLRQERAHRQRLEARLLQLQQELLALRTSRPVD